jgi:hypothetical protein
MFYQMYLFETQYKGLPSMALGWITFKSLQGVIFCGRNLHVTNMCTCHEIHKNFHEYLLVSVVRKTDAQIL